MAIIDEQAPGGAKALPASDDAHRTRFRYYKDRDVLTITFTPARPSVSLDLNGEAWARIVPTTSEIVGYEIEDFGAVFLQQHRELGDLWDRARARTVPIINRSHTRGAFSHALLTYLREQTERELRAVPRAEA